MASGTELALPPRRPSLPRTDGKSRAPAPASASWAPGDFRQATNQGTLSFLFCEMGVIMALPSLGYCEVQGEEWQEEALYKCIPSSLYIHSLIHSLLNSRSYPCARDHAGAVNTEMTAAPILKGDRGTHHFRAGLALKSEESMRLGRHREGKVGFPEEAAQFSFAFHLIMTMAGFKRSLTGCTGVSQMWRREGAVSQGRASPDCIPHEHPLGPGWAGCPAV